MKLSATRSVPSTRNSSARQRQLTLEPLEARVGAHRDEAELVEPGSNLRRFVAVQLPELDALVAQPGDAAQRSLEIALAVAAKGVEHQSDPQHANPADRLMSPAWEGR